MYYIETIYLIEAAFCRSTFSCGILLNPIFFQHEHDRSLSYQEFICFFRQPNNLSKQHPIAMMEPVNLE